tara:strand:+ start:284 stop:550 length:267 start_codon:yes stop_codon:yes gene_type:complete
MTVEVTKLQILDMIKEVDIRHPSEFYVSQQVQVDCDESTWTLRVDFDGPDSYGRVMTSMQLRAVLLKALAYEDLMDIIGSTTLVSNDE